MNSLKILIVSDLHCSHKQENQTRLYSDLLPNPPEKHPVEALKKLIKSNGMEANLLLCPGDITDKIDQQGFISGYNFLKDIKQTIGAEDLICTLGNHDVDSRGNFSPVFNAIPKGISQSFPLEDVGHSTKYWSDHFCLVTYDNVAILNFNSVYTHTNQQNVSKSIIEHKIISEIELILENISEDVKFRVAMCHHHPMKHYNSNYPDSDVLDNGDLLLQLLSRKGFQLFIHGHKHEPRLNYYNALPVLASGSFSSRHNVDDLNAQNVFHLVELNESSKGTIETYVYGPNKGWQIRLDTYFPCFTGFGYRGNIENYADRIQAWIADNGGNCDYEDLEKEFEDIAFLIPDDQIKLNHEIKKRGFKFIPELPNRPDKLSKIKKK